MGREVKRVPMDFDAPLDRIWEGMSGANPHYRQCPDCGGSGETSAASFVYALCRLFNLGLQRPDHPFLQEVPQYYPRTAISEDLRSLAEGLCKEPLRDCNDYTLYEKLKEAAGVPEEWGDCPTCKGKGMDPAIQEAYDNWEPYPPPAGDGWQMWSSTIDGPVSPVFGTPEELATYCADYCSTFGYNKADYATWFKFITGHGHKKGSYPG